MSRKLFLLDGMALAYRAHFAMIRSPMINSAGMNTSAVFGFTNVLLNLIDTQGPTHLAVAFDTREPTERHRIFPEYKAQREAMPEDLSLALPFICKMIEGFGIPILKKPGYEADDIIGTLARKAEQEGFETYMVTPDKDFGQLVAENTYMFKPGRSGGPPEIMGITQILEKWGIEKIDQVRDILGLSGDVSDNIPGVPGVGDKTAQKLIQKFGSMEGVLANTDQLKGKQKEKVEQNKEQALLSKKLVTINCEVPIEFSWKEFELGSRNDAELQSLLVEMEFNSLGKRLFGEAFKAGRGGSAQAVQGSDGDSSGKGEQQGMLFADLKTLKDVKHSYRLADSDELVAELLRDLKSRTSFCFDTETTGLDPKQARLIGLAFSFEAHSGWYVPIPENRQDASAILELFRSVLEDPEKEKVGHHLKYDLSILLWHGIKVRGPLFDTMLAHFLIDQDSRHSMDFLAERYMEYSPLSIKELIGEKGDEQKTMDQVDVQVVAEYAAEDADVTWQLRGLFAPLLKEKNQEKVFHEVECPLIEVLVGMEYEGISLDTEALLQISESLVLDIQTSEKTIYEMAGREFNLNSPKQMGEVLFGEMKLVEKPKKTKTGQFMTNEQVLTSLEKKHPICAEILNYRQASKLKSTYVDALPETLNSRTGRIHTTFHQAVAATGRLASSDPNIQNIPIRTERGREIRKAFIPRVSGGLLLSADYSQIELRIIASISGDPGMKQAFEQGVDIHLVTASKVYGIPLDEVSREQRSKSKMVNFGIVYGISAFGLAQRLNISRTESADLIKAYNSEYPGIHKYMEKTIAFAQEHGYVETLTGRRRYLRDINSRNATVRGAAERNAINSPIQGTAADMIKLAMARIHRDLEKGEFQTRMILQVHDELVFELEPIEKEEITKIVEEGMKNALPMDVPIEVDIGVGANWLEAH